MPERPESYITCPHCKIVLSYLGTKQFHEGTRTFDVLGGIAEAFKHREAYDVYCCNRCGRLEMFLEGVGDALRGETSDDHPVHTEKELRDSARDDA